MLSTTPIFDMDLPQRLESHGVEFAAAPPQKPSFLTTALSWVVPPLIFILVLQFFARRQMGGGAQGALSFTKSKAKVYVPDEESRVTFADVAGVDETLVINADRRSPDHRVGPPAWSHLGEMFFERTLSPCFRRFIRYQSTGPYPLRKAWTSLNAQTGAGVALALAGPCLDERFEFGIVDRYVDHHAYELIAARPVLAMESLAL